MVIVQSKLVVYQRLPEKIYKGQASSAEKPERPKDSARAAKKTPAGVDRKTPLRFFLSKEKLSKTRVLLRLVIKLLFYYVLFLMQFCETRSFVLVHNRPKTVGGIHERHGTNGWYTYTNTHRGKFLISQTNLFWDIHFSPLRLEVMSRQFART